jgi:hypothetical protein
MPTNRRLRVRDRQPAATPELGALFLRGIALDRKYRKDYGDGMSLAERDEYFEISRELSHAFDRRPWMYCLFEDFSGPEPQDADGPDRGGWRSGKAAQKALRAAARMKG